MKKQKHEALIFKVLPELFKEFLHPLLDKKNIETELIEKAAILDSKIADLKIPETEKEEVFDMSCIMFYFGLLNGAYEIDKENSFHKDAKRNSILKMSRHRILQEFGLKLLAHYFADKLHKRKVDITMYLVGMSDSPLKTTSIEYVNVIAETDDPVLITGETGTGKELLAEAVHYLSKRKDKVFIPINCGGLNEETLLSELFGHKKGAFSGATEDKKGAFELADEGTLFLDEVGDMLPKAQVALLRTLTNSKIQRLGEYGKDIPVAVRIIAATNKNLREEVKNGNFREDLYYRLRVHPMRLPAFRDLTVNERFLKIRKVIESVLKEQSGTDISSTLEVLNFRRPSNSGFDWKYFSPLQFDDMARWPFSKEALEKLLNFNFPGNFRELQSVIKNAWVKTKKKIELEHLSEELLNADTKTVSAPSENWLNLPGKEFRERIEDIERKYIMQFLNKTKHNMSAAARMMGIERYSFDAKMKKLGLQSMKKREKN